MDIQGAELKALIGANKMLINDKIDCIYTEILFSPLYEKQTDFFGIYEYLKDKGYHLFGMYNLTHCNNGLLAWGDAIFINKIIFENINKIY